VTELDATLGTIKCAHCGKEAPNDVPGRRFCQKACNKAFHLAKARREYKAKIPVGTPLPTPELLEKSCEWCHSKFTTREGGKKFCSAECRKERQEKRKADRKEQQELDKPDPWIISCEYCGNKFEPKSFYDRLCSKVCKKAAKPIVEDLNREKVCEICSTEFTAKDIRQRLCSDKCRLEDRARSLAEARAKTAEQREAREKDEEAARVEAARWVNCPICDREFRKKMPKHKFCSRICNRLHFKIKYKNEGKSRAVSI